MNHHHVTIAADLSNGNAFTVKNVNIPWPSIMTVRQIDYKFDGTELGDMIWGNFVPSDDGILGAFHDGTSVAPNTTFHIQKALLGDFSVIIKMPGANGFEISNTAHAGNLYVKLEFEPAFEKVEKKSN